MNRLSASLTVAPILIAAASAIAAVPLSPGGSQLLETGSTLATEPQLDGTVAEDISTPFSYLGTLTDSSGPPITLQGDVTGTLHSRVVLSIDGTYDFYWRIEVDPASFLSVGALSVFGFAPATYNVGWRADDVGEVSPSFVTQDVAGNVNFQFTPEIVSDRIGPGGSSYFLFLDTDAHAYAPSGSLKVSSDKNFSGSQQISFSGESGLYSTFAPVPEPAIAWTMLAGMAALIGMRLRKRPTRRAR